ncbi:MAG: signal peptidase I [Alphaproteobacteria bacterium]|nr:signal peptidase I [Alphaproteobacteria bacterium]
MNEISPIAPASVEPQAEVSIEETGADQAADEAAADVESPVANPAEPKSQSDWLELTKILVFALLIALFERTFFFQPYNIPSGSMEDTLLVGDYLFVQKFSYGYSRYAFPWGRFLPSFGRVMAREPERGDVVVFALPSDPSSDFIKRVVGLPGDRIQMLDGVLYINDKPVPKVRVGDFIESDNGYEHHIAKYRETLPNGKSYYVLDTVADGPLDTTQVYVVPPGHYFMMGDNRDDSDDSRGIVGYLPGENLIGKAEFKFVSIDETKTQWWSFWTWPWAIRYERLFTLID